MYPVTTTFGSTSRWENPFISRSRVIGKILQHPSKRSTDRQAIPFSCHVSHTRLPLHTHSHTHKKRVGERLTWFLAFRKYSRTKKLIILLYRIFLFFLTSTWALHWSEIGSVLTWFIKRILPPLNEFLFSIGIMIKWVSDNSWRKWKYSKLARKITWYIFTNYTFFLQYVNITRFFFICLFIHL